MTEKELIWIDSDNTLFLRCLDDNYEENYKIVKLSTQNGEKSVKMFLDDKNCLSFGKENLEQFKLMAKFLE